MTQIKDDFVVPTSLALNHITGEIYVSDRGDNTVTVISPTDWGGPARFSLSSEIDGKTYSVTGIAENMNVTSFAIFPNNGIELSLEDVSANASLQLVLLGEMIDGIYEVNAFTSDEPIALQFEKTENGTYSTLSFVVPENTSRVQINATEVVPEFHLCSFAILAAATAAGIGLLRIRNRLMA